MRLTSILSILSPLTSYTFMNVSSEQVAKTDLLGWQARALSVLECELKSQISWPFVEMILT